jgi:ribose/xylose/arabinose/galactoside ABC-type transport system permease subunit
VAGSLLLALMIAFLNLTMLPASFQKIIQGGLLMIILVASVPRDGRHAAA